MYCSACYPGSCYVKLDKRDCKYTCTNCTNLKAAKTLKRVYPVTLFHYKYSDAVGYLCKAGLCYSIAKRFSEAGIVYEQAAAHERNLGATVSAASLYHEAAKCIEKDNPHHALMCYSKAISAYCQVKRFTTAARLEIDSARLLEEDKNFKGAREHWQRAENLIRTSGTNDSWADRCQLRVAEHAVRCQDFNAAAHMFEQVGVASLGHNLLKFNVPGHFMLALLCMFATVSHFELHWFCQFVFCCFTQ